jgi:Phosphotransferase enzyme family
MTSQDNPAVVRRFWEAFNSHNLGIWDERIGPIASQILGEDAVPVGDLVVEKIGRGGGTATVGIFRVTGNARIQSGDATWSVVVKALGKPENPGPNLAADARKEAEVYRSRAFAQLCGGVRAPDCYAIHQLDDVQLLWLEDLSGAPQPPWPLPQYVATAHHLGHFNAHWPEDDLPSWEWLSHDSLRDIIDNPVFRQAIDQLPARLNHPLVSRFVTHAAADELRQLWETGAQLVALAKEAPQGVCHVDCHPKNLFPMSDPVLGSYTVAIDWEMVGIDALGIDIAHLIGSPLLWLEISAQEAEALVNPVFDAYMAGLRTAGWSGDERAVRRTFCTRLAYNALRANGMISHVADNPTFRKIFEGHLGYPMEKIAERWSVALPLFFAWRDEALQLAQ